MNQAVHLFAGDRIHTAKSQRQPSQPTIDCVSDIIVDQAINYGQVFVAAESKHVHSKR
jgi:hypothetical protein